MSKGPTYMAPDDMDISAGEISAIPEGESPEKSHNFQGRLSVGEGGLTLAQLKAQKQEP